MPVGIGGGLSATLAAASNAGSAATLIGNPQNILIGSLGRLDFWRGAPIIAALLLANRKIIQPDHDLC